MWHVQMPCKGCTQRHEKCWSHCKRYQDVKDQIASAKKEVRKHYIAIDYTRENKARMKRKLG